MIVSEWSDILHTNSWSRPTSNGTLVSKKYFRAKKRQWCPFRKHQYLIWKLISNKCSRNSLYAVNMLTGRLCSNMWIKNWSYLVFVHLNNLVLNDIWLNQDTRYMAKSIQFIRINNAYTNNIILHINNLSIWSTAETKFKTALRRWRTG
jgi:hypothetical protein